MAIPVAVREFVTIVTNVLVRNRRVAITEWACPEKCHIYGLLFMEIMYQQVALVPPLGPDIEVLRYPSELSL